MTALPAGLGGADASVHSGVARRFSQEDPVKRPEENLFESLVQIEGLILDWERLAEDGLIESFHPVQVCPDFGRVKLIAFRTSMNSPGFDPARPQNSAAAASAGSS